VNVDASKRIKERFDAAVRWGREVAREEAALRQVEYRLRMARCKLQATEDDLLLLLPVKSPNTKIRLSYALASSATADAILESLSG
jgi:hypothetical protein